MGKEKKEIGKLLELYRNYLTDDIKRDMYVNGADEKLIDLVEAEEVEEEDLYKFLNQLSVLKKFIKWLVENDKIDFSEKYELEFKLANVEFRGEWELVRDYTIYEQLLMLLAIQDEPIRFLCEILK